jgi:Zn-finger nucleic acid-binding protein
MYSMGSNGYADLLLLLIVGCMVLIGLAKKYRVFSGLFGKETADNRTSYLLSFYTRGHDLTNLYSSERDGVSFRVFITHPHTKPMGDSLMGHGAVIYAIDLDFNTEAHIIGLGRSVKIDNMVLKSLLGPYQLEKVDLEGDFPNHFDLFAAPNQQSTTRYVFDPEAMQSVIKYCENHFWELVGDELYVVASNKTKSAEGGIIKDSTDFIGQIRPAIKSKFKTKPASQRVSYGVYKHLKLNCPICSTRMDVQDNVHICPHGHGLLMGGQDLIKLRNGQLEVVPPPAHPAVDHAQLTCPNCKNKMINSRYQGGDIVIDSCPGCPMRWLDAVEEDKIASLATKR